MEVMDLRPSRSRKLSCIRDTNSLVSLSSNMSIDSELASGSGLFQVANGSGDAVGSSLLHTEYVRGHVGGDAAANNNMTSGLDNQDLPKHWDAAGSGAGVSKGGFGTSSRRNSTGQRKNVVPPSSAPLGESEQAYRALMSLMRSNTNNDNSEVSSEVSISSESSGGLKESFKSVATGTSGFWSAIAPLGTDEDSSSSSSTSSNGSETSSQLSELSPLTRKKRRQRRQLFRRRCARAMVGFVAMAAWLSGCVIYFMADDEDLYRSIVGSVREHVWGQVDNGDNGDSGDGRKALSVVDEEQVLLEEQMNGEEGVGSNAGTRALHTGNLRGQREQKRKERLERKRQQEDEMDIVNGGSRGGDGNLRRNTMVQGQEVHDNYYTDQPGHEAQGNDGGGQQGDNGELNRLLQDRQFLQEEVRLNRLHGQIHDMGIVHGGGGGAEERQLLEEMDQARARELAYQQLQGGDGGGGQQGDGVSDRQFREAGLHEQAEQLEQYHRQQVFDMGIANGGGGL